MSDTYSREERTPEPGSQPETPEMGGVAAGGALLAHASEVLRARLHDPEGALPARWSAADGTAGDEMHLNELLPLCAAWAIIDPDVARDLVLSAIAVQHADGSFPQRVRSDGYTPDAHAPWPLIAVAASLAAGNSPHPDFIAAVLPALERHLEWTLAHHDPSGVGRPRWRTRSESFLPDVWDPGLVTADLTAMILAEIDAVLSLASRGGAGGGADTRFRPYLRVYERALEEFLWDPQTTAYRDRDETGAPISRVTMSTFMPLIFPGLPGDTRGPLQARLLSGAPLGTGSGIALWERWPDDPSDPPVPATHQAVLWIALRRGVPTPAVERYRDLLIDRLAECLDRTGRLPANLASAPASDLPAEPVESSVMAAALVAILLQSASAVGDRPGRLAAWMETHRRGLAALAVSLATLGLIGAAVFTLQWKSMPGSSAEALLNLARECQRAGDHEQAIRLYHEFLDSSRGVNGTIRVLLGNALFRTGRFAEAESEYRKALDEEVSSLHALYNLGLTLNRQGRTSDAAYVLQEFVKTYTKDYPELAQRARIALEVIHGAPARPAP